MSGTLVTTGNLKSPFPSMAEFIARNAAALPQPIAIQTLAPDVAAAGELAGCGVHGLLDNTKFKELIGTSDCLIGHCGVGFLSDCLASGQHANFLPRTAELGEHIDNHQHELAALIIQRELGRIITSASSADELWSGPRAPSFIRVDLARHLPAQGSFVVVSSSGGHRQEGAETASELTAKGCQHLCTVVDEPIWECDQAHQLVPSCGPKLGMLVALPPMIRLLRRYRPDFVVTHGAGVGFVAAVAARLVGVPVYACESVTRISDSGRWFKGAVLAGARCFAPDHAQYLAKPFFQQVQAVSFAIVDDQGHAQ